MSTFTRDLRYAANISFTLLLNLLPLFGVFAWGWQVASLLFFYWQENLVIGIMTLIKMAMARGTGDVTPEEAIMLPDELIYPDPNQGKSLGLFLLIYGSFTIGHGLFLKQYFPLQDIPASEILIAFGAIFVAQIILFLLRFIATGLFRRLSMGQVCVYPLRRMILLHAVVIATGYGLLRLDAPLVGLLALVAGKAGFDLYEQIRNRRQQRYKSYAESIIKPNTLDYLLKKLDYLLKKLNNSRKTGNQISESAALNDIGKIYQAQSRYPEALDSFIKALEINQRVLDRNGEIAILNNIGSVYHADGNYFESLNYFEKALAISRQRLDRVAEGENLNNIGTVYQAQDKHDRALDFYGKALGIHRQVGNRVGECATLKNMGIIYRVQGNYSKALVCFEQALSIEHEMENYAGESTNLNHIGLVYHAQGENIEARKYLDKALAINRQVQDRAGEGVTIINIGLVCKDQGRNHDARDYFDKALMIGKKTGCKELVIKAEKHLKEIKKKLIF